MKNFCLVLILTTLGLLCLLARPVIADSLELRYGESVSYRVDALVRKPPNDCEPPFRPWGAIGLTLTMWVRNDTTQEALQIENIPLFSPGKTTLELTRPIVFGPVDLHHRRVSLRLPSLLAFFAGTDEYFIAARGTIADQINLIITLERITTDPRKRFCPMTYHVIGYRLPERSNS